MKVGELSVRVQGTNSASKRVAGELVSPGGDPCSGMKREKRLRMRGSLLLSEGARRLRDEEGRRLTSEGGWMMAWLLKLEGLCVGC